MWPRPNVEVKVYAEPGVRLPEYQTQGSAACDVESFDDYVIEPLGRTLVRTGLYFEIPAGYECQIRSRSGHALKHGIVVLNSPGTIDSDYRGEIRVLLFNTSSWPFKVSKGDRIAQLIFAPVVKASFAIVDDMSSLTSTVRADGGYGSTGR